MKIELALGQAPGKLCLAYPPTKVARLSCSSTFSSDRRSLAVRQSDLRLQLCQTAGPFVAPVCSGRRKSTVCCASKQRSSNAPSQTTSLEQGIDLSPRESVHPHLNGTRWPSQQNGSSSSNHVPQDVTGNTGSHQTLQVAPETELSHSEGIWELPVEKPAIRLSYVTGWHRPVIHFSVQGNDWQTAALERVSSSGGSTCEVVISLSSPQQSTAVHGELSDSPASLEFVITNGHGDWDKPLAGGNYTLCGQGAFVLQNGKIQQIQGRKCLVVTDLDDTLIGNDEGTQAFREFWEQKAVLRGSRLIFNTGRALDSFLKLQEAKAACLPVPDLLIAAVGTKLYSNRNNGDWAEDPGYASRLDEGWDLNVVREACYQAVMSVGREAMHFRPPDEQNDHKVTCGVLATSAPQVQASIQAALDQHNVSAKLIFSGKGEWRYLDIVSENAGKAEALEFAMKQLEFHPSNTIACGDSGNDKDMLAAANLAIVVGNAQPDLMQWLMTLTEKSLHCQGRLRLIQAEAHQALGILEGLQKHGFT